MVVISVFIIHCDTVNSRSYNRAENGKRERVVKRRFFGFFQKPDVAGALMGHARAFTRKLWKLTVTICEARLSGTGGKGGRKGLAGLHRRFRMERGNGHLSPRRYYRFFYLRLEQCRKKFISISSII